MLRIKRKKRYQAIEPDEILIDAENLPGFDSARLEGRIERPIERRAFRNILGVAALVGVVFASQLVRLQIVDADNLKERAEANRLAETLILAERGSITDRAGVPLALNTPQPALGFSTRSYPLGNAAAHILGYVSYPKKDPNGYWFQNTSVGLSGAEALFNNTLSGENGREIREISALGEIVSGSTVRAPRKGRDIALSIDAGLQEELYRLIKERTEAASFLSGSGIIMDIATGEIYALASYPSFDPEVIALGADAPAVAAYQSDRRAPFLDRAVSGLYAPGSVVKPFIALAALEERVITPEKQILSTGSISIPNQYNPNLPSVFKDWKAHGWVDMRRALAVSSDVYFYEIGGGFEDQSGLGISAIDSWMARFGFGAPSGSIFESEASGVVPSPEWKAATFDGERWFLGNTYHTAIGQYGFQVTPLQLVRAVAALGNGGVLVTPSIRANEQGERTSIGVSEENLRVVGEGMKLATESGGTAAALNVTGISVAGKTGTAEVGAGKVFINSLVEGFFPYENPRFAFVVVMERAKAGTTAGAPLVMRQLLEWIVTNRPDMAQGAL